MKLFKNGLMAVAVLALVGSLANAQDQKKLIERRPADREPTTDQEFVVKALACEMAEVKMAERAAKATANPDVEKFARQMIDDHSKLREALMAHAKSMKVAVVEGLEKEHRERVQRLLSLSGPEFDREYLRCQVEGHEKALKAYEVWSKKATSKELARDAERAVPIVKDHLEKARQLEAKLKG